MADFLPRRDADFLSFTARFALRIVSDPERYGVLEQAADDYRVCYSDFALRYERATAPGTRTVVSVKLKDAARRELAEMTRNLSSSIRGTIGNAADFDTRLIEIGLKPDGRLTPRRAPLPMAQRPIVRAKAMEGAIELTLVDAARPTSRARPASALLAQLFQHIGDAPPDRATEWKSIGSTSKMRIRLPIDDARLTFGTRVWFTCAWIDKAGGTSDFARPTSVRITSEAPLLPIEVAA